MGIVKTDIGTTGARTSSGGWGTATDGETWTKQAGTGTSGVVSNELQLQSSSASFFYSLGPSLPGADAVGWVRFTTGSLAAGDNAGILIRFQDNNNYYLLRLPGGGNTTQLQLFKKVSGTGTAIGNFTHGLTLTNGTFYWLKFAIVGTSLSCKIWQDGNAEPSSWLTTQTDTALAGNTGSNNLCGLYGFASTSTAVRYDNFNISDLNASHGVQASATLALARPHGVQAVASLIFQRSHGVSAAASLARPVIHGAQASATLALPFLHGVTATSTLALPRSHAITSTASLALIQSHGVQAIATVQGIGSVATHPITAAATLALARVHGAQARVALTVPRPHPITATTSLTLQRTRGVMATATLAFQRLHTMNASSTLALPRAHGVSALSSLTLPRAHGVQAVVTLQANTVPGTGISTLAVSTKSQSWTNVAGSPGTETDITSSDASNSGFTLGLIPSYGGMPQASWYEVDSGVTGTNQHSLSTTVPDGSIHWLEQKGGTFAGSEDPTFKNAGDMVEQAPTGTPFRRWYVTQSDANDADGLSWRASMCVYPGDPGLVAFRFDQINNGASISLTSPDSQEIALIGGLQQSDATWAPANGGYGTLAGGNTAGWPSGLTTISPDYVYIVPASGHGVNVGLVTALHTSLSGLGWSSMQIQYLQSASRLKLKVQASQNTIAANSTETVYLLRAYRRNLTSADAIAISADYINPGTPSVAQGSFTAFSYDERAYVFAASGDALLATLDLTPAHVTARYKPIIKVTGYASSSSPTVAWGGVALTKGVDYQEYVDTINGVYYLQLYFDVVASGAVSGQRNNAQLSIQAPATAISHGVNALATLALPRAHGVLSVTTLALQRTHGAMARATLATPALHGVNATASLTLMRSHGVQAVATLTASRAHGVSALSSLALVRNHTMRANASLALQRTRGVQASASLAYQRSHGVSATSTLAQARSHGVSATSPLALQRTHGVTALAVLSSPVLARSHPISAAATLALPILHGMSATSTLALPRGHGLTATSSLAFQYSHGVQAQAVVAQAVARVHGVQAIVTLQGNFQAGTARQRMTFRSGTQSATFRSGVQPMTFRNGVQSTTFR